MRFSATAAVLAGCWGLTLPAAGLSRISPPSSEEQNRILDEVRRNALRYTRDLPDFICTQVIRRYVDASGLGKWRATDTLTAGLSYFGQKEDYKLILVNDRPADRSYNSVGGATSTGEFGSMLREVFDPRSRAAFAWSRRATLRERRVDVFSYTVEQHYSQWQISFNYFESRVWIVAGHHGEVFVDGDTRMVIRVTLEAENIPASFPVRQARTVLDYDFVTIGDRQFLLPLRAEMRMSSGRMHTRNEVEFRAYRKFSAEASIQFDLSATPAPLPASETEERPPR